jgi:hypothetical protein
MAVTIEVGHRAGFVRAAVDQVPLEWDLGRAGGSPRCECRYQRRAGSIHGVSGHFTD